jgi:hypothetical protein
MLWSECACHCWETNGQDLELERISTPVEAEFFLTPFLQNSSTRAKEVLGVVTLITSVTKKA